MHDVNNCLVRLHRCFETTPRKSLKIERKKGNRTSLRCLGRTALSIVNEVSRELVIIGNTFCDSMCEAASVGSAACPGIRILFSL